MYKQCKQFLEETSKEIVLKISEDESIQTLKQIEEKSYLLERIQQIIQVVYQSQCQTKIIKLFSQINQLSTTVKQSSVKPCNQEQSNQSRFRKQRQMTFGYPDTIPEGQQHSQVTNRQPFRKRPSKNDENAIQILKSQNLQLQKQIISSQQQNRLHIKQLMESINTLEMQYTCTKQKYQERLQSSIKVIKQWEEKTYKLTEDKCQLQNGLEMEIQKLSQQRLKNANLQRQLEKNQIEKQKFEKLNKSLKSQISALNDKILRLEQMNQKIQRNCTVYQEQIKMIKKLNQVFPSKGEQSLKNQNSQNLKKNFQQMQIQQLQAQLLQKDNKILDLQKKYFKVKSIKGQIQEQFHINKINSQKLKIEFQNDYHQKIIKLQRQIRSLKQTLLNDKSTSKQVYSNNLLQLQTKYSKQKEQLQKNYESRLKFQSQKSETFSKKIKELQLLMKEKQLLYVQNAQQNDKKIKQLKSYTKQLQRSSSTRNNSCLELNRQNSLKQQLYDQQIRNLRVQNEKQKKQIQVKRNEIDKLKIQIKQSTKGFNRKGCQIQQQIDFKQYIQKIDELRHNNILLSSQLGHIKKELSYREDQVNQIQGSKVQMQQKLALTLNKLQAKQNQLNKLKKNNLQVQVQYQNETNSLHKKHQFQIQEVKKQLKLHYQDIIKGKQQKIDQLRQNSSAVEYKAILSNLKDTLEQERKKSRKFQQKVKEMTISVKQYKCQIKTLSQKINQRTQKYQQLEKHLFLQKQNVRKIVENYENKNYFNQMKFKDFKHEFYQCLREVFSQLKLSQKRIQEQIWTMKNYYQKYIQDFILQFYEQTSKLEVKHINSQKQIKDYYEKEIILKMQVDMQQMQFTAQKKSKQRMIDLMTILAEKQHQMKTLTQKQRLSHRRVQQLSLTLQSTKIQLKDVSGKYKSLKDVQEKLSIKVCTLERQNIQKSHNLESSMQKNIELKRQIIQNQNRYQEKMERCREKYLQQNQKLFGKYQRQFDKLIGLNGKSKNTGFSSVIMSPTNIIPTKQCQKVDNNSDKKLQTLKKEILLQKKKLQGLESRNQKQKIPSKGSRNTMSLKSLVKN